MREARHAMTSRIRRLAATLLVAVAAASCTSTPQSSAVPQQSTCGGVSSDIGGCSAERHTFTGSTCRDLAVEWATVLDKAVLRVLDGPDAEGGNRRSTRLRQALVIATADVNTRLQLLHLEADCDVPEFMAAAEPRFSASLRDRVGAALFDGDPVSTYQDWLADVGRVIRAIDDGESPAPSGS
jgi:hypothetical protein